MYAHCLFCNADLGRNEALEAFPVGRRLAYDAEKGRLWVVCGRCRRWNLTPLEERWEAIEQAERLYRGTRLRASTDNVGLARVADETDLVRIGSPLRPELAAWRYSDTFARRRRRAITTAVLMRTTGLAIVGVGTWVLVSSGFGIPVLLVAASSLFETPSPDAPTAPDAAAGDFVVRIPISGVNVSISRASVEQARVGTSADEGFHVTFPYGGSTRALYGSAATRATASMLAHTNAGGAPRELVASAVGALVAAGSADAYLARVGRRRSNLRLGYLRSEARDTEVEGTVLLTDLSAPSRLALEMAVHEEQERRALDGELAELARAWRDAEEIAAVADGLGLPRTVERAWEQLVTRFRP